VRNIIPHILEGAKHIYTDSPLNVQPKTEFSRYFNGSNLQPDQGFAQQLKTLKNHTEVSVHPLRPLMSQLRVIKSEAEVKNMRKAGQISGRALTAAMCQMWNSEKDLHAYLQYQFTFNGCKGEAYVPVIGGGKVCIVNLSKITSNSFIECSKHPLRPQ
jgi:intermediate cleaving peptidase 55